MPILDLQNVITVLPVTDYDTAIKWYTKLLGREADVKPDDGVAEWNLTDTVWLQVSLDPDNAGKTTVVFTVPDIEEQIAALDDVGIKAGEIVEYPGIVKLVEAPDPDGNKITFVEELA